MAYDGYLCLILHAHLPFVRHPEHSEFLEEDWFFEAVTETYLPLLESFESLWADGVTFKISMTLSPPLINMFNDALLRERYANRLRQLIQLATEEEERNTDHTEYLAGYYRELFGRRLRQFEDLYQRDLVGAFRTFQDRGRLEILTCGATHGFLPLMQDEPEAVRAQVQLAVNHYWENFGRAPRGIWLPECGYFQGLEHVLKEAGLRFFVGETHTVDHATPRPVAGIHAPIYTPSGVAVFARDQESSRQVWSAEVGYPGHPEYRDFYRDVGYDLPFELARPYVQPTGLRKMTGIKYHRVTGAGDHKEHYDPYRARKIVDEHASNFAFNRELQIRHQRAHMDQPAIVVSPYDAELFGHWWYEGPMFLDLVMRKVACDMTHYALITPSEYLEAYPRQQVAQPHFSTWGENGYADVWLNGTNDWIYPHLKGMASRMADLAGWFDEPTPLQSRALKQAARELLLAQSSDWAFIMHTKTSVDYAVKRTKDHINRFNRLYWDLKNDRVDEDLLHQIEIRDNLFPNLDHTIYKRRN